MSYTRTFWLVGCVVIASACSHGAASDAPDADPGSAGAADAATDGDGGQPPGQTGACAAGFVRCTGVCLDTRLVTDTCTPRACATPPDTLNGSFTPTTSREFVHGLAFEGGVARFEFRPGPGTPVLPATDTVDLHLRVDGGAMRSAPMVASGAGWRHEEPGLAAGQVVEYYFTQHVGPNAFHPGSPGAKPSIDSAWFQRELGVEATASAEPLVVEFASRFRDRHRNEWRYDHYVAGYDSGASYTVRLTDRGSAVDVEIVPDPAAEVGKVDLKWYETFGDTPFCNDPPALAGLAAPGGMTRAGNRFTYTIDAVTPGQQLEFELTFTDRPDGLPTYYSEWFHYYVGTGALGQRTQDPRAYAAGEAGVSDVSVHQFAYAQHAPTLSEAELGEFVTGKIMFETDFATGRLVNPPTAYDCNGGAVGFVPRQSPRAAEYADALGPGYDSASCIGCHHLDGRGAVPEGLVVRLFPEDPTYGGQLAQSGRAEGRLQVTYEQVAGQFDDGTTYQLQRPVYAVEQLSAGPIASGVSVRLAPPAFGMGLLEAVPDETILGLADETDANGDGISGRPGIAGDGTLGRFGWQATQPTVRAQSAAAFENDMGLAPAELAAVDLDAVDMYVRGLSVPPRDNVDDPAAERGKRVFDAAGCAGCHVPNLVTAIDYEVAALAGQAIAPFTDLLLHDMGEDLADASGSEWRTPPLWGLGYAGRVAHPPTDPLSPNRDSDGPGAFLHDGRARTPLEAVLWHGGEAAAARAFVLALSAVDREDLIAYLRYPFADPLPIGVCNL